MKIALYMVRGRRKVIIGHFPSKYRAYAVYANLGWSSNWKPIFEPL